MPEQPAGNNGGPSLPRMVTVDVGCMCPRLLRLSATLVTLIGMHERMSRRSRP
jgi:hypothetical protein